MMKFDIKWEIWEKNFVRAYVLSRSENFWFPLFPLCYHNISSSNDSHTNDSDTNSRSANDSGPYDS